MVFQFSSSVQTLRKPLPGPVLPPVNQDQCEEESQGKILTTKLHNFEATQSNYTRIDRCSENINRAMIISFKFYNSCLIRINKIYVTPFVSRDLKL